MVIGITGHINLGGHSEEEWTQKTLSAWMASQDIYLGITCLAPGTDQIFARICIQQSIPYRAIIPCSNYDKVFSKEEAQDLELLTHRAHAKIVLEGPASEKAFWKAGQLLVQQCDLLLAVWNGLPARGLGGTADVVNYACQNEKPVIHINPIDKSLTHFCNSQSF